jgi:hypothetical protein
MTDRVRHASVRGHTATSRRNLSTCIQLNLVRCSQLNLDTISKIVTHQFRDSGVTVLRPYFNFAHVLQDAFSNLVLLLYIFLLVIT